MRSETGVRTDGSRIQTRSGEDRRICMRASSPQNGIPEGQNMKNKVLRFWSVFFGVLWLISVSVPVFCAVSAPEPPDVTRKSTLRLTYEIPYEDEYFPLSGLGIEIFRAVSYDGTSNISLTGAFRDYPVAVSLSFDPAAWNRAAETLSAYADADGIVPDAHAYTDDEGTVRFDDLEIGFYLIRWDENTLGDNEIGFAPFILCIPAPDGNGGWNYDINAKPKPGGNLEDLTDGDVPLADLFGYSVVKLWMDAGCQENRPESIEVEICRDGVLFTTVELNDENHWSYSWIDREPHRWTAVERNVPDSYTVEIEEDNSAFIITNCSDQLPTDSPKTGVSSEIPFIAYVSGALGMFMLLLALITYKRGTVRNEG